MYNQYDTFKGWTDYFQFSNEERRYFTKEFKGVSLNGKRVLEIGYGSGAMLAWLAEEGADVSGIEITDHSLEEARQRGFKVYSDMTSAEEAGEQPFDMIVAFDVLEHLSVEHILALLKDVKGMLAPGGQFFVRVPNGRSPWGLSNQYGDLTHMTVLSDLRLRQLGLETGFRLALCRDQAVVTRSSARGWMLDAIFYSTRRVLNTLVGKAYGLGDMPLGANIVAILKPNEDKKSD